MIVKNKTIPQVISWTWLITLFFLSGCQPAVVAIPSPRPTETSSSTKGLPLTTASPMPTIRLYSGIAPDQNHLDHWQEIELALGNKLFGFVLEEGPVLCEWVLLGHTDTELYLYSYCSGTESIGTTHPGPYQAQIPAVILLGAEYEILGVELPGAGTHYAKDIRRLFPPEAVEIIFGDLIDFQLLSDHLDWRIEHREVPPYIVLAATPQP